MSGKVWGNEYRTTTVCIDEYSRSRFAGRLYNPYLETGVRFDSLIDLLLQLEELLDAMRFPQSFTAPRSFTPKQPVEPAGGDSVEHSREQGRRATFSVRIFFRQNATWQGAVAWLEKGQEQTFRSALELIFLMHSALTEGAARAEVL